MMLMMIMRRKRIKEDEDGEGKYGDYDSSNDGTDDDLHVHMVSACVLLVFGDNINVISQMMRIMMMMMMMMMMMVMVIQNVTMIYDFAFMMIACIVLFMQFTLYKIPRITYKSTCKNSAQLKM